MSRIRASFVVSLVVVAVGLFLIRSAKAERLVYGGRKVSAKEANLIELGRRLFFDPLVSRSGERSCASCHDPEHGFSDPMVRSEDDVGDTVRHSQTIIDSHLNPTAHWDGEFSSIEALVVARVGLPRGTQSLRSHGAPLGGSLGVPGSIGSAGDSSLPTSRRRGGGGYGPPPSSSPPPPPPASGTPRPVPSSDPTPPAGDDADRPVTPDHDDGEDGDTRKDDEPDTFDVKLLSKLPRVQDLLEEAGRYDEAFKAAFGSPSVTTARMSEAIAAYCRSIVTTEADYDRYASGDKTALSEPARRGLELFQGRAGCVKCHTLKGKRAPFTDFEFHNTGIAWDQFPKAERERMRKSDQLRMVDQGRERLSRRGRDRRAFKTATLRDLTRRGPYMHTGVFDTLHQVVRYYAAGGSGDEAQDKRIRGFDVTEEDVADLVAFLESLTGDKRPGLAPKAWRARPESTRLRFVDGVGKPLSGIEVTLHPVGDVMPGVSLRERAVTRQTDDNGWIEYAPFRRTHARVALSDGLMLTHGDLVPDTCEKAELEVPVRGKTIVMLTQQADKPMPEVLVAEHLDTLVLPGHNAPRTRLQRGRVLTVGDTVTARYEGWFRTDVPAEVRLRLPNETGLTEKDLKLKLHCGKPIALDLSE